MIPSACGCIFALGSSSVLDPTVVFPGVKKCRGQSCGADFSAIKTYIAAGSGGSRASGEEERGTVQCPVRAWDVALPSLDRVTVSLGTDLGRKPGLNQGRIHLGRCMG